MADRPRIGEAVHFVEHRGQTCMLAVVRGYTHPMPGDDAQWCISLDFHGWGHHDHVPHGHESKHWHTREEHDDGR